MTRTKGSAAAPVQGAPRSAVRSTVLRCSDRLLYVGQLAQIAGGEGRPTHGARYLVSLWDELADDVRRLRAHVETAPPESP